MTPMDGTAVRRIDWRARRGSGWWAFAVHRISGLLLAVFLPAHFLVLGQALAGPQGLDAALAWSELPLVKASEVALVFLLALHAAGGLRLLLVEFLGWRASWQPAAIAAASGIALAGALAFALNLG